MVWEPKNCCVCATPKIGTLVLGWLGLIGSALNTVGLFRYVNTTRDDFTAVCKNITKDMDHDIIDTETCVDIFYGSIGVTAVVSVIGIIICGLLIWGVNKYKPAMMMPYLCVKGFGITLAIAAGVLVTGFFIYVQLWLPLVLFVVFYGLVVFLDVYLFLVVRVCYKEVKQHSVAMGGGSDIMYVEQRDALYPQKM
ncbi:hypothetical protein SK128_026043 [Halocaridina rubra]|uniref:DUF7027 domain-containing protein n=1 Tax=Halocaridina rubra TaxID=373956 RepID=A0AAN8X4M4_HALRR